VTRTHRQSTIEQDIVVYAKTPRIDFVTRADWHERQTLLKAAFPVAVRSTRATYEVQFGAVERPTHRNTSWDQEKFEVAAQRWADLSESGYGVSLLNDCKYGHDTRGNVLRITLLRGATWPDPKADEGAHAFTYSLFPHAGNWTDAETVRRAAELNIPARALPVRGRAPDSRSFLTLTGLAVVETLKPAEDGRGLILRVYEPHGSRGEVRADSREWVSKVTDCDLVEEDGDAVTVRDGRFKFNITPFQIRTFRIE
jgi:alpha-mannosidase